MSWTQVRFGVRKVENHCIGHVIPTVSFSDLHNGSPIKGTVHTSIPFKLTSVGLTYIYLKTRILEQILDKYVISYCVVCNKCQICGTDTFFGDSQAVKTRLESHCV